MRAARLHGLGDVRVAPEAPPVPGSGEVLVQVTAVGLCGSDLHWFGEGGIGDAVLAEPLVLGHEFAGVIAEGPRAGTRVAVDPAQPCGTCQQCLEGNRNLCPTVRFAGHGRNDGGLRELVAWPAELVHPVPESISDADAAMLEPLGVALHAMDLAHVRLAGTVAVVGCGPIGLCVVQLARAAGATQVVAIEPLPHRRAAAAEHGADLVLDPTDPDLLRRVDAATKGRGIDVAIEVAGTDEAVDVAVQVVRPGGTVVLAGIPGTDRTSFPASTARRKGLTLKLSRRMKEMYPRTIGLVDRGLVDLRSLVTYTFPLEQTQEAFQVAALRTGLKVIVAPSA